MYKLHVEISNFGLLQTKTTLNKYCRFDLTIAWYAEGTQSDPDCVFSVCISGCIFRRNEKNGDYEWSGPKVRSHQYRKFADIMKMSPAIYNLVLDQFLKQDWIADIGANFVPLKHAKKMDLESIKIEMS